MASVYLGRAVADGGFARLVAIKVMHPHIAEKPEFEAMFLDEARLAASIRHPNVVSTIDVQKSPEAMFLVMDYIDGPALNRVLRALKAHDRRLPIELTLRILIDTLSGLEAAHQLNDAQGNSLQVVHRDVSPQNILVGGDGIARITDFGVARAEARLGFTIGGEIKGKLGYMPPEQSKGEDIDCRADIYAAGVVLWECLTLERLFAAESAGELIYKLLQGAQQSPQDVCPEVPYHIDRVCMNALSLDVHQRYQSATDFAQAIEDAALQDGVRVATSRELAAFVTELKPLIGDADGETKSELEFGSIAATPSAAMGALATSGVGSGTGRPHTIAVKARQPGHASQGRMVTALASVVALTVCVGAMGVMMVTTPTTAERLHTTLSGAASRTVQAALNDTEALAVNQPPATAPPATAPPATPPPATESPATDSVDPDAAPDDPEQRSDDPPVEPEPGRRPHQPSPLRRPTPTPAPTPSSGNHGPGYRPGGL